MHSIRVLTENDIPAGDLILRAAHSADFSFGKMLRRNRVLTPDCWWIMEADGQAIGVVGATSFKTFAHIGLMAVLPEFQSGGTGSTLLQYAIDQLECNGFKSITLYSTNAGLGFYPRHNFEWSGLSTEWQLRKRREHLGTYRVSKSVDFARIVAFDKEIFAGDREPLLRILEQENNGRILIAENADGLIQGFIAAQQTVLGPFVASTKQAAGDLLSEALNFEFDGRPRVLLPEAHQDAESLMAEFGFEPLRTSRYFVRGVPPKQQRQKMYGQGAYSLG